MNVRRLTSLKHVLFRRIRSCIQQIVHDIRIEQHRILRHDADVSAQTVQLQVSKVVAVDGDRAVCHVVEAEEELERCGLSATGLAYDGGLRAGCDGEVDAVEDWTALLGLVGEFDVVEGDLTLGGR